MWARPPLSLSNCNISLVVNYVPFTFLYGNKTPCPPPILFDVYLPSPPLPPLKFTFMSFFFFIFIFILSLSLYINFTKCYNRIINYSISLAVEGDWYLSVSSLPSLECVKWINYRVNLYNITENTSE